MNKIITRIIILITLGFSALLLFTHEPPYSHAQTGDSFDLLGQFGGMASDIFVDGDKAYTRVGPRLTILDASTLSLLGQTDALPDIILDIEVVSNNVAYIANSFKGLAVVDVSDPTSPRQIGSIGTNGRVLGVEVVGNLAYIANGNSGLAIINVSDPASPTLISSFDTDGSATDVTISGDVAYIADSDNGLIIVDVSDPAFPFLIGSIDTDGYATEVQVEDNTAYIAHSSDGLLTIDVTNPNLPVILNSIDTSGHAANIHVVGNIAYVTALYGGLVTVDVSNPASPIIVGTLNTFGQSEGVQVVGNIAYIANAEDGVMTVDVSDPTSPTRINSVNTNAISVTDVEVVRSVAYVTSREGLSLLDINDPTTPTLLGHLADSGNYKDVEIVGSVAYITDGNNGLVAVDVSDPTSPFFLGVVDTGNAYGLYMVRNVAYVADYENGLVTVDVSDPTDLTILDSFGTTGLANDVQVIGNIAYMADGNGLMTVDVSDPTSLARLGFVGSDTAISVDVVGNLAYMVGSELTIVDVSDPNFPSVVQTFSTDRAFDVQVVGSNVYITTGYSGVVTIDTSDISSPIVLDAVDTVGYVENVEVVDDVVYAASGSHGLYLLKHTPPPSDGDQYESDDRCDSATMTEADGTGQEHTFHDFDDQDWVKFDVLEGKRYNVIGNVPLGSPADLVFEIFIECNGVVEVEQGHSFAPGVRFDFVAPTSETYYLKMYNNQADLFGTDVSYSLSVREIVENAPQSAVIIVAGKQSDGDILQDNIHHVTNNVYKMYRRKGHDGLRIQYFASDLELDPMGTGERVVNGVATVDNLREAITSWAVNRVSDDQALTLYMMSHGDYDRFFLDGENEVVTPAQLDSWLTTLEESVGDVPINVVIDACHSGSFIDSADTISKPGRVVITSSERNELAWASNYGAIFSDFFTFAIRNDYTLYEAFTQASDVARGAPWPQTPLLDSNGNGIPNEPDDGLEASSRGFEFAGSFATLNWEPYISELFPVTQGEDQVTITARVLDDSDETAAPDDDITDVWAVLYPPSYTPPPADGTELVAERQPIIRLTEANGTYTGQFCPTELGTWEAVVYAEDGEGLISRPETITFDITADDMASCPPLAVSVGQQAIGNNSAVPILLWVVLWIGIFAGCGLVCEKWRFGR